MVNMCSINMQATQKFVYRKFATKLPLTMHKYALQNICIQVYMYDIYVNINIIYFNIFTMYIIYQNNNIKSYLYDL